MTTPLRAAVYTREDPNDRFGVNSLTSQVGLLIEYAETSDSEVVKVYRERAADAAPRRPLLAQMLADAQHGVFDQLFILESGQLSRTAARLTHVLARLARAGVEVVCVLDQEDAP